MRDRRSIWGVAAIAAVAFTVSVAQDDRAVYLAATAAQQPQPSVDSDAHSNRQPAPKGQQDVVPSAAAPAADPRAATGVDVPTTTVARAGAGGVDGGEAALGDPLTLTMSAATGEGQNPAEPYQPEAAEPVPMPTNDFRERAANAFGDRFAGISYPVDEEPEEPDPNNHGLAGFMNPRFVLVKEGAPYPPTFEGVEVKAVRFSLAELQTAWADLAERGGLEELEARGVTVTMFGIDEGDNVVQVGILPPLTSQARATFQSVLGGPMYRLSETGYGMGG